MKIAFAMALMVLCLLLGMFLIPTVLTSVESTVAEQGASWNSEVKATVGMFFIVFIVLVVVLSVSWLFTKR